jgi:hypothetical protein
MDRDSALGIMRKPITFGCRHTHTTITSPCECALDKTAERSKRVLVEFGQLDTWST